MTCGTVEPEWRSPPRREKSRARQHRTADRPGAAGAASDAATAVPRSGPRPAAAERTRATAAAGPAGTTAAGRTAAADRTGAAAGLTGISKPAENVRYRTARRARRLGSCGGQPPLLGLRSSIPLGA